MGDSSNDTGAPPETIGRTLAAALHDPRWATCTVEPITGGMSNLTFLVRTPAGEAIMRRPPLGHVLPSAHDMGRELRLLRALRGSAVPVPPVLATSDADGPLGVACYFTERVIGHVCRDAFPPGYCETDAAGRAIGEALVGALAALHQLDPAAVGLENLGRPQGFLRRQLARWREQWSRSNPVDEGAIDGIHARLMAACPDDVPGRILHGDYRLDNVMLDPATPGRIAAVLDWEMSTLGDPLTDLGVLLTYWAEADDDELDRAARIVPSLTAHAGFPSRAEVVRLYADRTGAYVGQIGWYVAFAYFKNAVICQGIIARVAAGAAPGVDASRAEALVGPLLAAAGRALDRAPQAAPSTARRRPPRAERPPAGQHVS
jgi:aminoglycoside phosphotransferase (APT) family kinase protein